MVPSNGAARTVTEAPGVDAEALEFVRFCHRRKHVGWPELYDEMCAVAGRGLYRGYRSEELNAIGIGFGLFEMPALAGLVSRVVAEDQERRRRTAEALRPAVVVAAEDGHPSPEPAAAHQPQQPVSPADTVSPEPAERVAPDHGSIRIAVAAGA
jgi:hypothetical protein